MTAEFQGEGKYDSQWDAYDDGFASQAELINGQADEIERLRAALTRLEQIYITDRVAADQAREIETIFDEHLHSSVGDTGEPDG